MTETYTSGLWVAKDAWKSLPEFKERIGRVRAHCEEFRPTTYELVTTVA